jgi:hypothetical protein
MVELVVPVLGSKEGVTVSLPIIFRQRFRMFIGRITDKPPQPFPGATTLFTATRFDDTTIDILFRRALNRDDAIGMGDVLNAPFTPGELKGATKIEDVLATIGRRARVSSVDSYRTLIEPGVNERLALALAGAQFPPRPPGSVQPTDPVSEYVTALNVDIIARECNLRLDKWLLSLATIDDFSPPQTVGEVSRRLLARMVVL